jgi:iron complex outermembrane receptor protein
VGTGRLVFHPRREPRRIWSGFLQDEIALPGSRATLTLGSKVEYSDLSGLEAQPSLRLGGRLGDRQFLWASFSRAVRTPSRAERDVQVWLATVPAANGLPVQVRVVGNHDLGSEELLAYEAGYRVQVSSTLDFDLTAFNHRYDRLFASSDDSVPSFEPSPPRLVLDLLVTPGVRATTRGAELTGRWISRPGWAWSASYWYLRFTALSLDPTALQRLQPDSSPRNQARLSSRLDLPRGGELDLGLRYTDSIPILSISPHLGLDARLAWRLPSGGEIALVGRDLLAGRHFETGITEEGAAPSEIGPGGYLSFAWTW